MYIHIYVVFRVRYIWVFSRTHLYTGSFFSPTLTGNFLNVVLQYGFVALNFVLQYDLWAVALSHIKALKSVGSEL